MRLSYILIFLLLFLIFFKNCFFKIKEKITNRKCNYINYKPENWNKKEDKIQKYNNCYSYAMKYLKKNRNKKLQPGEICKSNIKNKVKGNYSCNNIINNIECDFPNEIFKLNNKNDYCPCGYYKVALYLDNSKPNKDFHFYRQDELKWSHKPGNNKATNLDATNNAIKDPDKADRNYKHLTNKNNYEISCGFFCKKNNLYLDK